MSVDPKSPDFNPWPDFTAAMHHLVPDLPEKAVVYSANVGDKNTSLTAGVVVNGKVVGSSVRRSVAKTWLNAFIDGRNSVAAEAVVVEAAPATDPSPEI